MYDHICIQNMSVTHNFHVFICCIHHKSRVELREHEHEHEATATLLLLRNAANNKSIMIFKIN